MLTGIPGFDSVHLTQFIGAWFYFVNRDLYYAYMAVTKESFGLLITTLTHWWAPTVIRISGDASVAGQLSLTPDGRVECAFPERMVMIANHQVRCLDFPRNIPAYTFVVGKMVDEAASS